MTLAAHELARITVDTPDRRLDLAVPAGVKLADVLGVLVRTGGERLAERGAATGWVLRRVDGTLLSGAKTLQDQGVRDGDRLHLVPADESWPQLEYDDLADAIAATRRDGMTWSPEATRRTGVATGVAALAGALVAVVRDSPHGTVGLVAGGFAAVLLSCGIIVARTARDRRTGSVVTGSAIPFAFVAALFAHGARPYATDLLVACVATVLTGWFAAVGVGRTDAFHVAAMLAAAIGAVGAGLDRVTTPLDAAAIMLSTTALGAGLVPAIAVRLGGIGRMHDRGSGADALAESVRRSDTTATGLCAGIALAATAASSILARSDVGWTRLLMLACLVAFALRARIYGLVRQRLAGLAAAAGVAVPLIASAVWTRFAPVPVLASVAILGGLVIVLSTPNRRIRFTSRAANVVEAAAVLAILPLLAGVLDLYAKARSLA
jgi:type VII secretion integral membrane protein EccD